MKIIQVYSPTFDAEEKKIDKYYGQSQTEIDNTCRQGSSNESQGAQQQQQ